MVGYEEVSGKIKHYRVDKMQEIRVTEESRLGRENFKDFDLAAFARKTFGMYGGEDRKITLEGENHLVGVVIDRFGTDVMIHPHDQEHFHAGVTVTVSPQFFGWLAGIGKTCSGASGSAATSGFPKGVLMSGWIHSYRGLSRMSSGPATSLLLGLEFDMMAAGKRQ